MKEEYLERMRRWVEVAETYEFADRLAMLAASDDDGRSAKLMPAGDATTRDE